MFYLNSGQGTSRIAKECGKVFGHNWCRFPFALMFDVSVPNLIVLVPEFLRCLWECLNDIF